MSNQQAITKHQVILLQQGDAKTFSEMLGMYEKRIFRLVNGIVRNPSDAEDVTQETFVKVYKALPKFRGDSALYTWIHQIASNTAINFLKSVKRRVQTVDIDNTEISHDWNTTDATPEQEIIDREMMSVIQNAVDGMSPELREAFALRELEGLSYNLIAETVNCPIGTVRSRIFRARESVDEKLKEFSNENNR
ncbi:MAG: sigma-70 family RNA polymerase sigma factor [Candidatus Peribacteraceae bacterium]|nr:sigma-70 family RNA polymerase sigma factor [Candidatus Peribacteraceae bacterium]